jgi:hypothetical protein
MKGNRVAGSAVAIVSSAVIVAALVTAMVVAGTGAALTVAAPDPTPTPLGTPFDPMVRPATIGTFPAAMRERRVSIGPDTYAAEFEWDQRGISDPPPIATGLSLGMWREGGAPWQQSGGDPVGEPVDDVNGHPAFWASGAQALRWEFRPGAWIQLRLEQGLVNADVYPAVPFPAPGLAETERVARSVRYETGERLRFPWHLRGMPPGLVPLSAQIIRNRGYQPWTVELVLAPVTRPRTVAVIVRATAVPEADLPNGRPAAADGLVSSDTDDIFIATRDDVRHELAFLSPAAPKGQDLAALFAGFELFDDPAGWTERPLDG